MSSPQRKTISDISREMLLEIDVIGMPELWKIVVDNLWHTRYTSGCVVCKGFCVFEQPEDYL